LLKTYNRRVDKVTYLLGNFQLARFLSSTKVTTKRRHRLGTISWMAQIVHEGDWDPDPSAIHNLLRYARDNSTLEVKFKRVDVRLQDPQAANYPLWYITGHHEFAWSEEDVARVRRYLKAGGMLVGDACCGRPTFDGAFRRELAKVFPEQRLNHCPPTIPCTAFITTSGTSNTRHELVRTRTP